MYWHSKHNLFHTKTLSITHSLLMKPDEGAPSAVIRFQSIFYANMKAWRPF